MNENKVIISENNTILFAGKKELPYNQQVKLSAIEAYRKYGITKSTVRDAIINNFDLSTPIARCMKDYFTRKWDAIFTVQSIENGVLEYDGISYIVIYHKTTRLEVINSESGYALLSFRNPQKEFELFPYVLITVFK